MAEIIPTDTYINKPNPDTNYGSGTSLILKNDLSGPNHRLPYLNFDFSSLSGGITNATLELVPNIAGDYDFDIYLVDLGSEIAWDANTLTWNNHPMFDQSSESVAIDSTYGYHAQTVANTYTAGDVIRLNGKSQGNDETVLANWMQSRLGQSQATIGIASNNTNFLYFRSAQNVANTPPRIVYYPTTHTLTPIHDGTMRNSHPDTVRSSYLAHSEVSGGSGAFSYIAFDLSGVTGTVDSAVLYLTTREQFGEYRTFIHGIDSAAAEVAWDESTATFNNTAALRNGSVGSQALDPTFSTQLVFRSGGWAPGITVQFDITSWVEARKGDSFCTLGLGSDSGAFNSWLSKESVGGPELRISTSGGSSSPARRIKGFQELNGGLA